MFKLIGEENKINYGCIDEPLDFNYKKFRLCDIFGKEIRGLRKRFAFNIFNYIGVVSDDYFVGIAIANMGYAESVFGFVFSYKEGMLYEYSKTSLPSHLDFPANPDEYVALLKKRDLLFSVKKSHNNKTLDLDCDFAEKFSIKGSFQYGFSNKPLRVLNPSCGDPNRFTFTEKCSPLVTKNISVMLDGKELKFDSKRTFAIYDWTGGYLNRNTNWLWSAFAGEIAGKVRIGANFAALVNESYFPENAFWIDSKRKRVANVIYDFNMNDPYKTDWRIYTEDGSVDLKFDPHGERKDRKNIPFVKLNFRQFIGEFTGVLRPEKGKSVKVNGIKGISEIHFSVW